MTVSLVFNPPSCSCCNYRPCKSRGLVGTIAVVSVIRNVSVLCLLSNNN